MTNLIVALPGAGFDGDYVRRAFSPLSVVGTVQAHQPNPYGLVTGYRQALDEAAKHGPVIVVGVSVGALVGAWWALEHPQSCVGLVACLPPWCGSPHVVNSSGADSHGRRTSDWPDTPPAAHAALATAAMIDQLGIDGALAYIKKSAPPWLHRELTRSWHSLGPGLSCSLREISYFVAPTAHDLRRITCPTVVISAHDDPVHPASVGREWSQALAEDGIPHEYQSLTLEQIGSDPESLGKAALAGLSRVL